MRVPLTDADELLNDGARSSVEGIEWSTFSGPALEVTSIAVLADSKSVASLHALDGSDTVAAQARHDARNGRVDVGQQNALRSRQVVWSACAGA